MKNFDRNGNEYKMKPQLGTYVPLVAIFSIMTLVGFIKMPESFQMVDAGSCRNLDDFPA